MLSLDDISGNKTMVRRVCCFGGDDAYSIVQWIGQRNMLDDGDRLCWFTVRYNLLGRSMMHQAPVPPPPPPPSLRTLVALAPPACARFTVCWCFNSQQPIFDVETVNACIVGRIHSSIAHRFAHPMTTCNRFCRSEILTKGHNTVTTDHSFAIGFTTPSSLHSQPALALTYFQCLAKR
jgi:hypothetical protein